MHVLIASRYLPWPLIEGGRVAQYRTFEALRGACTFTLVIPIYSPEEETAVKVFAEQFPDITVEPVRLFQLSPPHPHSLRHRAGNFLRTIWPPPKTATAPRQNPAGAEPYYPFACLHRDIIAAIERQFAKGCDIFQAEFADMMSLGPYMAGRVPTLFVHHQLHFVYARRFLEANNVRNSSAIYKTEKMLWEEPAYLNSFNSAIVFSKTDQLALSDLCPNLQIHVSPFPSPDDPLPEPVPFSHPATTFVFVGSEANGPNLDGLRWFVNEVWPHVKRQMPDARIEVIGRLSASTRAAIPSCEAIAFSGFVPNLAEALREKIMIVPVWIGSGIRTKILVAWSASCPVITTSVGVEGLPGRVGEHFLLADDAPSFATACIELAGNVPRLNQIGSNGLSLVKQYYSLDAVRKSRLAVYESLAARPN